MIKKLLHHALIWCVSFPTMLAFLILGAVIEAWGETKQSSREINRKYK